MTADGKRRKAFAEYKLIFPSASDTVDHLQHTMVFGSVRSQTLQKLMFINFMVVEPRSPLHQELPKIHNECNLSRAKRSEDLEAKGFGILPKARACDEPDRLQQKDCCGVC